MVSENYHGFNWEYLSRLVGLIEWVAFTKNKGEPQSAWCQQNVLVSTSMLKFALFFSLDYSYTTFHISVNLDECWVDFITHIISCDTIAFLQIDSGVIWILHMGYENEFYICEAYYDVCLEAPFFAQVK